MTTLVTQEEWLAIIERAVKAVPRTFTEYKAPGLGTVEFAKCIDPTLLKLDATTSQVKELCGEARKHDFKVSANYHYGFWMVHTVLSIINVLPSMRLSSNCDVYSSSFQYLHWFRISRLPAHRLLTTPAVDSQCVSG